MKCLLPLRCMVPTGGITPTKCMHVSRECKISFHYIDRFSAVEEYTSREVHGIHGLQGQSGLLEHRCLEFQELVLTSETSTAV